MRHGYEAMNVVRQRANDLDKINYTDTEILENINSSIRFLSQILINRKAPEMIGTEVTADYQSVPAGFHSFVGNPPLWREGDVIRSYNDGEYEIRFWQYRKSLNSLTDIIPFPEDYFDAVTTAALMLTLMSDEYDVSAEQAVLGKITELLP